MPLLCRYIFSAEVGDNVIKKKSLNKIENLGRNIIRYVKSIESILCLGIILYKLGE